MKRFLAFLLCLTMLASLAACGSSTEESSGGGQSEVQTEDPFVPTNKTISVSWFVPWWMDASDFDFIFDEFARKHPGYTIVPNALEDLTSLLAAIQAGNQPDVWMGGDPNNTNFVSGCYQSLFKNLDDYLTRDPDLNFNTLDKNQMSLTKFAGGHYALPYQTTQFCLVYNKTLFAKKGIDPEKPPVTWSEYLQYVKTLTDLSAPQIGVNNGPYSYLLENCGNRSGSLMANGIDSNMNSDWMLKVNQFCTEVEEVMKGKPGDVDFSLAKGNVAINAEGNMNVLNDYAAEGVDIGIAKMPRPDDDTIQNIPSLLWNFFSIPTGAKNPDGGWLFAKFCMTEGLYQSIAKDFQKNPSGLFPQFIAHKETRERVYSSFLSSIPEKTKKLIEARDKMVMEDELYIIPFSPIHSTFKAINSKWDQKQEAGEVGLADKLKGIHNEYQSTLQGWKNDMIAKGWTFPEGAEAIPPEGYGK